MSSSCTGADCSNKLAEYKNGIDKLLKRLRDSEHTKSEYEIINLTLKQKLNRPSKIESKHFQQIFSLIQELIEFHFNKGHAEDSIQKIFVTMIDSLWSLLASRYSDLDSWLDLKYMGTHIVENLMKLMDNNAENKEQAAENVYETLANLKEAQKSELNNINLAELNKEVDFLRNEANVLNRKVSEQNAVIKSLIKSFKVKLNTEQKQTGLLSQTTTTTSSSRLSSTGSNEPSSGSFNFTSSQTTNVTLSSSSQSDKLMDSGRSSTTKETLNTYVCPTCKVTVDARRCSFEKFEKHVVACSKDTANCVNVHLKEHDAPADNCTPPGRSSRKHSGCTSGVGSSTSGTGSSTSSSSGHLAASSQAAGRQQQQPSSDTPKNYMIIQNFEPKPRKRL